MAEEPVIQPTPITNFLMIEELRRRLDEIRDEKNQHDNRLYLTLDKLWKSHNSIRDDLHELRNDISKVGAAHAQNEQLMVAKIESSIQGSISEIKEDYHRKPSWNITAIIAFLSSLSTGMGMYILTHL